jgi:murein L,D-transpeptidase YcbB/YkuD
VSAFQKQHGLLDDGIVGQGTLEAMNISVDEKIDQVRVNMERARWLVNDLIQKRIIVNIANFNAYLFDGDERSYSSKVMVGKTYTKTPVFESTLKYVEINPTWTVPRSIVVNEMLPRIKRDPDYLRNRNMVLLNSQGQVVSLENVDLAGSFPYSIRQGPGPGNALGRVKFIFPNSFSVYLHDTPSRSLFAKSARAFSHGCIRVENPLEWAEILINDPEWDQESINKVVRSGKTTRVFPKEDIRVMIVYFTHLTDLDGTVYFYSDIYDRDQPVLDVLNAPIDDQVFNYKRTEIIKRIEE